jgi:hypothetical protein
MSKDEVRRALQPMIDAGVIHTLIFSSATYGSGTPMSEEVFVSAIINAPNPEDHRQEIERLLKDAGIAQVNLTLYGTDDGQGED